MKRTSLRLPVFAMISLTMLSLGCHHENEVLERSSVSAYDQEVAVVETPVAETAPHAVEPSQVPQADIAPLTPDLPIGPNYPITSMLNGRSQRFYRSVFADHSDIEPWLLNYVGSYGVMPTRYGRAPFMYSFEVDADNVFDGDHHRRHHD